MAVTHAVSVADAFAVGVAVIVGFTTITALGVRGGKLEGPMNIILPNPHTTMTNRIIAMPMIRCTLFGSPSSVVWRGRIVCLDGWVGWADTLGMVRLAGTGTDCGKCAARALRISRALCQR